MAKKPLNENKIISDIYPIVEDSMKRKRGSYVSCVERFIHKNTAQLHDYAPIDRIFFTKVDTDDFFRSLQIDEKVINETIKNLYYYDSPELQACKDPYSLSQLMIVRYFMIKGDKKNTELACMYLAFSGKFYASCHYKWFSDFVPKREVMDYVVNYMLSKKFDLITQKSVWGAIRNLVNTWASSYSKVLTDNKATDDELVYLIHQLYERIYAFLRNIAKPYYDAYEKKLYLNAESDNYENDANYRVVQNNSTYATTVTERTMTYMTSTNISLARCHSAAGGGVDPYEIKAIFENILNNNATLEELRYVINILIVDFMRTHPSVKDITNSIDFLDYSIKAKPNTKDKDILMVKNNILGWLSGSSRYKSIKTPATKNNYYRAILIYITLSINIANKGD